MTIYISKFLGHLWLLFVLFQLMILLFIGQAYARKISSYQECSKTKNITIAFVGDIIFQNPFQRIALEIGSSYKSFWSEIEPVFRRVDALYGNLEGTLVTNISYQQKTLQYPGRLFDTKIYRTPSKILNFNYHYSLASDLKKSGFTILSTGNNHALDRGGAGINQTIDVLEQNKLLSVGTRHSKNKKLPWGRIFQIGNMKIGWVACTYGTNGHEDKLDQVLDCYSERGAVLNAIHRLSTRSDVAAVFFVPHWGIENHLVITRKQKALAIDAINSGATAVIGTHPHILQKWEWVKNSHNRKTPIVYSTGNFISAQNMEHQRHGMILVLSLRKRKTTDKAELVSIRYMLTEISLSTHKVSITNYDYSKHSKLPYKNFISKNKFFSQYNICD